MSRHFAVLNFALHKLKWIAPMQIYLLVYFSPGFRLVECMNGIVNEIHSVTLLKFVNSRSKCYFLSGILGKILPLIATPNQQKPKIVFLAVERAIVLQYLIRLIDSLDLTGGNRQWKIHRQQSNQNVSNQHFDFISLVTTTIFLELRLIQYFVCCMIKLFILSTVAVNGLQFKLKKCVIESCGSLLRPFK